MTKKEYGGWTQKHWCIVCGKMTRDYWMISTISLCPKCGCYRPGENVLTEYPSRHVTVLEKHWWGWKEVEAYWERKETE